MNAASILLAGFGLGIAVGLAYFAGLWLTLRRVVVCAKPRRLLGLSRTARLLPTLFVMSAVIRFDPVMFLAMLPGFLAGRFLVSHRLLRPPGEVRHAS